METLTDPLSQAWIEHLRDQHDVAPSTLKARASVLRSLGNAGTATREEVEAWWAARAELSRGTRNVNLSHLRTFYRWCRIWGHRTDDPTERCEAPRMHRGLPRPFSRAEVRALLDGLEPDLRRAAALGAFAGLRVAEQASLTWADVDLETRRIRVTGKGGKTRVVGIGSALYDEIAPAGTGSVVTGGKPYSGAVLQRKLNRAIARLGVNGTTHQLRHRFGTIAYQRTHDILAVSRVLGHSSVATSAVYAAMSDDMIDTIADAVGL